MNGRKPPPGVCRYCNCTEENACRLPDGEACAWLNTDRDVCSAPACLAAHSRALKRDERRRYQRPRRRTPADILELRKQEQSDRRKRARLLKRARGHK
jgi:hypothetical protein